MNQRSPFDIRPIDLNLPEAKEIISTRYFLDFSLYSSTEERLYALNLLNSSEKNNQLKELNIGDLIHEEIKIPQIDLSNCVALEILIIELKVPPSNQKYQERLDYLLQYAIVLSKKVSLHLINGTVHGNTKINDNLTWFNGGGLTTCYVDVYFLWDLLKDSLNEANESPLTVTLPKLKHVTQLFNSGKGLGLSEQIQYTPLFSKLTILFRKLHLWLLDYHSKIEELSIPHVKINADLIKEKITQEYTKILIQAYSPLALD